MCIIMALVRSLWHWLLRWIATACHDRDSKVSTVFIIWIYDWCVSVSWRVWCCWRD